MKYAFGSAPCCKDCCEQRQMTCELCGQCDDLDFMDACSGCCDPSSDPFDYFFEE